MYIMLEDVATTAFRGQSNVHQN